MLQVMQAMIIGAEIGRVPPPASLWEPYEMGNPLSWERDHLRVVDLYFTRMHPPVWEPVTRVLVGDVVSIVSVNYTP